MSPTTPLTTEVAEGVHRLEHAHVNCYLVTGTATGTDRRVLLVDAGLPAVWPLLGQALRALGRTPDDVAGLVLTHAHFDHTGVAARLQERLDLPVWAHEAEHHLAAHPYRYAHENARAYYPLRYPAGARILLRMARAGALRVPGVRGLLPLVDGQVLDLPGTPRVVLSPGHTYGHCALHLPERDALLSGDALVTLDPYTGLAGPQIIAGAATADSALALRSLDRLVATGATTVLPGHGEPWTGGIAQAVAEARALGAH